MSKNYGNDSQIAEIVKYISDTMKLPLIGAGGGFAPIGTLNFYDGTLAPQGWLICDGTVYNIADYPELASHYASHHGASNFYGGDGTTTFAVPDLRGEFLRMIGTNSHTNQGNGANLGVHQDGTEQPWIAVDANNHSAIIQVNTNLRRQDSIAWYDEKNTDNIISATKQSVFTPKSSGNASGAVAPLGSYTTRPTNTSFLICVKATVSGDANAHQYSTEEQIVGTTEDGETIYEKTIKFDDKSFSSGSDTNVPHGVSNIGESWLNRLLWRDNDGTSRPMIPYCDGNLNSRIVLRSITSTDIVFRTNGDSWSSSDYDYVKVTIRYTKTSS